MNLCGLDVVLHGKLTTYARKFKLTPTNIVNLPDISRIVVFGNGTPDDIVTFTVCHRLNGDMVAGAVKPKNHRGASTFTEMRTYLNYGKHLSKVLFLLDQENNMCEGIIDSFNLECRKQGIDIIQKQNLSNGHLYITNCTYGERALDIIVVISGLENINSNMHNIEDHLLLAASQYGMIKLASETFSSENTWNSLPKKEQEEIFHRLLNSAITNKISPQQMQGLSRLK